MTTKRNINITVISQTDNTGTTHKFRYNPEELPDLCIAMVEDEELKRTAIMACAHAICSSPNPGEIMHALYENISDIEQRTIQQNRRYKMMSANDRNNQ